MNNKAFTPLAMVVIIAGLLILGVGGYAIIKNAQMPTSESELESEPEFEPGPIIGGDKDIHGCLGPAGYSWCEAKQKCLRVWEEDCLKN